MTKNKHEKNFNIAWGDMDALNHVNHARFFDYFQEARIEWLKTLNLTLQEEEGPVVIHVACTYLTPLVYPATVKLITSIEKIGNTSLTLTHNLFHKDKLCAEGISKLVWVNYMENKPVAVPEIFRSQILRDPTTK